MSKKLMVMTALMSVCLIASNMFEIKIFSAGKLTLTGGLLVFPISYVLNDCITEVYGAGKARYAIFTAFCLNLFFVAMAQIVRILPAESFWEGQEHFDYMFAADLRITAASMLAFLAGSLLNSTVMSRMKSRSPEKGFGWRAITSTLVGESLDSLVFFPFAFWGYGMENVLRMMVIQVILKTLYEVIVLPLTALCVKALKREETA